MRFHMDGDHPQDVACRVRDVLRFLSTAIGELDPRATTALEDGPRQGLGYILLALEESADYVERAWAART